MIYTLGEEKIAKKKNKKNVGLKNANTGQIRIL